jgi:hypothetical protein
MSNFLNSTYTNVNDLVAINADSITCDTFLDQPSSYYTGLVSNIQSQIDNINTAVSSNIPTFSIGTVTSLPSTSQPTVTKTGTNTSVILNFGLVQGADGQKGDTGPQGPQGPKGDTGNVDTSNYYTKSEVDNKNSSQDAGITANSVAIGAIGVKTLNFTSITPLLASVITGALACGAITCADVICAGIQAGNISGLAIEGVTSMTSPVGNLATVNSTDINATTVNTSDLNVTFAIDAPTISATTINATNINATGTIKNNAVTLGTDGSISGNSLSIGDGFIDAITTSNTNTQNIDGSTVNIGHAVLLPYPDLTRINLNGAVYINNVLLQPFSSASSFFSQW